jgi:hypothetical protein
MRPPKFYSVALVALNQAARETLSIASDPSLLRARTKNELFAAMWRQAAPNNSSLRREWLRDYQHQPGVGSTKSAFQI